MFTTGDKVSVSQYFGSRIGTVHRATTGYVTVSFGRGHTETFDLSRRTIRRIEE